MKYNQIIIKSVLCLCMTLSAGFAYALQRYYCEHKGIENYSLSPGLKSIFDFGKQAPYDIWGDLNNKLKFVDEKGKDINFNSMVDAANYMSARGWKFQQAYISVYSGSPTVHWILYKDAENMKQAMEGIMTKSEYNKTK